MSELNGTCSIAMRARVFNIPRPLGTHQDFNGHDSGTDLLEVPTIYKAYVSGLCFREYPNKIWPYMVQYLYFRILEFPLKIGIYPII